jgi:predicted nucleotidyltransferase
MKVPTDLRAFVELLNARGVKYVIVGGYAVGFHGHVRFTGDIDIFIDPSPENADRVVASLDLFGFASLGLTSADFQIPDHVIQLGYPPTRIDILSGIDAVDFADAYASRIEAELDGLPTAFISKSLLIQNKEAAHRDQDLADLKKLRS